MSKKGKKTPVQPIRMYLLKPTVHQYKDALQDKMSFDEFGLKPELNLTGRLYLKKPEKRDASWVKFLQQGIASPLPKIQSSPHAAVLFLNVDNRIFAVVFGMGRYMLKDTAYEADFGILSALNAVDPDGIRSADTFQFEAVGVQKRTQASRTTSLGDFGVDPSREHFRAVTGKSRIKGFAERVTGTEGGLGTNVRVTFAELAQHCSEVLKAYHAKTYKDNFPHYGNLRKVADKSVLASLHDKLLLRLTKRELENIHLFPPEPLDYEDFSGFSLTPKGDIHDELDVADYLDSRTDPTQFDIETLKQHRIFLRKETVDEPLAKWSVYKSLVCEIKEGRNVYILMNGEWYRIASTFAGQIKAYIEQIPEVDVGLPSPTLSKTEPAYMTEVRKAGHGLVVLDTKLAMCEDAGRRIEVCDVLTSQRDYVHAKRKEGGSSALSHLFMQGCNSALALLRDSQFRKEARQHLQKYGKPVMKRVPVDKPKSGSFRVVFAVMGRFRGTIAESLPFFSKLSLMHVAQELAERGVKVAVAKVEMQ